MIRLKISLEKEAEKLLSNRVRNCKLYNSYSESCVAKTVAYACCHFPSYLNRLLNIHSSSPFGQREPDESASGSTCQ